MAFPETMTSNPPELAAPRVAWQAQGRLPNFLIIGAARSGTTTLHYVLGQHPQIYMSPNKETNFFSFYCNDGQVPQVTRVEDVAIIDQRSVKTLEDYCFLFRGVNKEIAIGEASPSYLLVPEVPLAIRESIPDAKIIVVLRQPIEKAYSHYLRKCPGLYSYGEDFAEVLERDEQRIAAQGRGTSFLGHCRYYSCLKRYYEVFEHDRIKVCLFEELEHDPEAFYADLFRFLGVDPGFKPDVSIKYNQSGLGKARPLVFVTQGGLSLRRRLIQHLPPNMASRLSRWRHKLRSANIDKPPPLDPALRRALTRRYFEEEIRKLQDLIGRDLSSWLAQAIAAVTLYRGLLDIACHV